jgi:hypothetical protein
MPEYKSNEWEFQSFVISWLTEFLSTGSYPFDTATANTSSALKGIPEQTAIKGIYPTQLVSSPLMGED